MNGKISALRQQRGNPLPWPSERFVKGTSGGGLRRLFYAFKFVAISCGLACCCVAMLAEPAAAQQGGKYSRGNNGGGYSGNYGGGNYGRNQSNYGWGNSSQHHAGYGRHDKQWQGFPQHSPYYNYGFYQRPYPFHLDYYRMKYQGSYEPYAGNLYGPPLIQQFVTPQFFPTPFNAGPMRNFSGAYYW